MYTIYKALKLIYIYIHIHL